MDAYQALMEELAALRAPAATKPMFTEDQQRQRIRDNNTQVNLGLAGALSPIAEAQSVGGQVFKRALGDRDERITARGTFDPLTGVTAEDPEYADQVRETRRGKVLQAALSVEERRRADQQRSEDRAADRASREAQAAEGRALRLTIAQMTKDSREAAAAAKAGKAAAGKVLPAGEVRKLSDSQAAASTFGELVGGFRDDFSTYGTTSAKNFLGKNQPLGLGKEYGDQSNWWQNYNDQKNLIRNKLFGSALTAPEKAAFDAANITEGMDAGQIRERLAQQHRMAARAYNKLKQNFGKAGYGVEEFEDLMEPEAPRPGAPTGKSEPTGFRVLGVREK